METTIHPIGKNERPKEEEPKKEETKEEPTKEVKKKASKPRCFHCKKKLKMTELNFKCKCNHVFCHQHLNPHSHKCSFNYLKERQEHIQKNNPKMCGQCIEVK